MPCLPLEHTCIAGNKRYSPQIRAGACFCEELSDGAFTMQQCLAFKIQSERCGPWTAGGKYRLCLPTWRHTGNRSIVPSFGAQLCVENFLRTQLLLLMRSNSDLGMVRDPCRTRLRKEAPSLIEANGLASLLMAFCFYGFPARGNITSLLIGHLALNVAVTVVSDCHCAARSLERGTWTKPRGHIRSRRMIVCLCCFVQS
ncbi:uncharacterized protein M421DRAFT_135864 [Didymella exigua CBS 183.55]|uniref:Uncharacterized protein n=1 Tax=Didymella exigua CBS 183.55 TaxID=1150837 RepID=A0A6A5RLJ7_9PLEO|nr:uncharacterized protein M421DRAFT_135864 [Didymella exigua CBS 183.55]KAF1929295.1 hypothetical protein M421DRAFT_135864 [Didymella exigua CBS 183.55]